MSELIDNREKRIEQLKKIIQGLHEGVPEDEVRKQLREIVRETDASEIAAMEQQLMADGMPAEKIMAMCDLHSEVVRDILVERPHGPVVPGHPVDTFKRENRAIQEAVDAFRTVLNEISAEPENRRPDAEKMDRLRRRYNDLMDIDKHYSRKENLLFPCLEKHGITGPSRVMWGKDDEVRELLKGLGEALAETGATAGEWKLLAETVAEPALRAIEEMISKEENILLPMSLDALAETEWSDIWSQSPEIGYCLVEPGDGYRPEVVELLEIEGASTEAARPSPTDGRLFVSPTGVLSMEQIEGIFDALPVDITFVDADDCVRYFSGGQNRIFARPRAILGRKVQHCHPPASLDVVERIISDFRSGRQDACSFWIDFKGRFIYIRYFAARNENGEYLGTLEVTQDLTEARALEGERRLLEYDGTLSEGCYSPSEKDSESTRHETEKRRNGETENPPFRSSSDSAVALLSSEKLPEGL